MLGLGHYVLGDSQYGPPAPPGAVASGSYADEMAKYRAAPTSTFDGALFGIGMGASLLGSVAAIFLYNTKSAPRPLIGGHGTGRFWPGVGWFLIGGIAAELVFNLARLPFGRKP